MRNAREEEVIRNSNKKQEHAAKKIKKHEKRKKTIEDVKTKNESGYRIVFAFI